MADVTYYDLRPRSAVRVTDDTGQVHDKILLRTSGGIATLRVGGRATVERPGIVNIQRVEPFKGKKHWQITFDDQSSWLVDELAGCGCGGGR